jgi:hypothetical protein
MINELINGPQLEGAAAVACSDLLDLIIVMFVIQLVMAVWLYDLTRIVCKRGKQPKATGEQL